jgi:hypothetical protein
MFIQANPIGDALNNTEWAFPTAECFHIAAFALSIGTIAIVDFRLLGLALRGRSVAQLVKDTTLWTLLGLVIVVLSGMALFLSDPRHYFYNQSFRFKIVSLLVAILYNYTIHAKVASGEPSPVVGKLVGGVSLALWLCVVSGGLFIAFV